MSTAAPPADLTAVADWLELLCGQGRGYVQVVNSGDWSGRSFPIQDTTMAEMVSYVDGLDEAQPQGIFARVTTLHSSPPSGKRGGMHLTATLPMLWGDIDIAGPGHQHAACDGGEECAHRAENGRRRHAGRVLPLPPDRAAARAIVESAYLPPATLWIDSGGGLYPIWILDPAGGVPMLSDDEGGQRPDPGVVAEMADLSARWQEMLSIAAARLGYHYGTGVGDLARVLRIPGTWNRKTDTPRMCHVLERSGGTYTMDDLRDTLAQAQVDLPAAMTPAPRKPPRERSLAGDVRPGDDFIARVDWSDPLLLGGIGWRETYNLDGGERGWLRPGGHSQLSATTGRNGLDNLWVFSTSTDFPPQEVISKFEAYRIIHGYGTHKEATKALNVLGFGSPAASAANGRPTPDMDPFVWPIDATGTPLSATTPNGTHGTTQSPPNVAGEMPVEDVDPDGGEEEEEVDTWLPVDLGPYLRGEIVRSAPDMGLSRSDGVRMIYPGKEHAVIGEMESGKSWWALGCAAAEMLAERHVIYIHFEEADPTDTVERLRLIGCTDYEILTYFHFVGPSQASKPRQRKLLARMGASLVVLDGINEGMSLHKADIRDENGAAEFRRVMVKPFTKRGAAVINLDHVVKDTESRGRYALGSIHKGNALDGALIVLETMEAFGRGIRGASAVYATKDRPGFLRRHGRPVPNVPGKTFMGVLVVDDTRSRQPALDLRFWAPADPESVTDEAAVTMEEGDDAEVLAAVVALTGRNMQATFRNVRAEARLGQTKVADALARLVVAGTIQEGSGDRGARLFTVVVNGAGEEINRALESGVET